MEFKEFNLGEKEKIEVRLKKFEVAICDYTIATIYMWRDYYKLKYYLDDFSLVFKLCLNGKEYYSYPIGNIDFFNGMDEDVELAYIEEKHLFLLKEKYDLEYKEMENWGDYLYEIDKLAGLKGRKYHGKRNKVNKFIKENKNYYYEKIDRNNINLLFEFVKEKIVRNENELFDFEINGLLDLLDNYFSFNLEGLILYSRDSYVIGFTIGEVMNDILFVHIEKADRRYNGAYEMINYLFSKEFERVVKWVNREEDLGIDGLRKAKMSYHPDRIIKKYYVKLHLKKC